MTPALLQIAATVCLLSEQAFSPVGPRLICGVMRVGPPGHLYVMQSVSAETVEALTRPQGPILGEGPGGTGLALKVAEGELSPDQERVFELAWPDDQPLYYLKQEGPDLYRRVMLADKEGCVVKLRPEVGANGTEVNVEITRSQLTGGQYHDKMNAFVDLPQLVKMTCTTVAPIAPGTTTVVMWRAPSSGQTPPMESTSDSQRAPQETTPVAPEARQVPVVVVVLKADEKLALEPARSAPPATGAENVQIEVRTDLCAVPFGSPAWMKIRSAPDTAACVTQLIADGDLEPFSSPRVAVQNNRRGEVDVSTPLSYFLWDEEAKRYAEHEAEVTNSLGVTPRVNADGSISMGVECRLTDLAQVVKGPRGQRIPVITAHTLNAHVTTGNGQLVVIGGLSRIHREVGEDGQEREEPVEILIIVTPRILTEGPSVTGADEAAATD